MFFILGIMSVESIPTHKLQSLRRIPSAGNFCPEPTLGRSGGMGLLVLLGSDNCRLAATHHAGSGKVNVAGNKWLFSWYIVRMTQRTGIHVNKLVVNQSVYHQFIVKTDNKTRVFYHNLTCMKLQYAFSEYRIGMISFV